MDEQRRLRAQARRARAILRKTSLQSQEEDLSPIRGAEALTLLHRLTLESWSLSGRQLPEYRRDNTPYRFVPGRLT